MSAFIASQDFARFEFQTIGYVDSEGWHLEVPALDIRLTGESPDSLRKRVTELVRENDRSRFLGRLAEVKNKLAPKIPEEPKPEPAKRSAQAASRRQAA